ncbi:MAG TPA: hypothetical protein VI670_19500 [Thermoanaerobaculia bacterium]|jgi:hypothetical protein
MKSGRLLVFVLGSLIAILAHGEEPIAYIGHGSFFDFKGNEIQITQAFVDKAQAWYRANLMSGLDESKKREFAELEQRLQKGIRLEGQTRLVVQQRELEWLFANSSKHRDDHRTLGKLRALAYALTWRLPADAGEKVNERREEFKLDPEIVKRLDAASLRAGGGIKLLSATVNSGQAYINECMAARVPIPPSIGVLDPAGTAGWKSQGFIPIPNQFIGQNMGPSPAEVRTFKSTSPSGMCYALPRYTDLSKSTVGLDGVICLSEETSKVCFWDNQMMGSGFSFPAGTQIPIGVPNLAVDSMGRYQAGGFELLGGSGGICTDCHAGENPYITHPKADLGGGVLWETLQSGQGLPTFAPNRYDPLVAAAWPQNQLSQAAATVPGACGGCHVKGFRGRFPHLSNELPGYCFTVLTKAYQQTMPPPPPATNPGSQVAVAQTFRDTWCNGAPDATSADAGDPHLRTTNGIRYDFQSAGEFVALKNSDTGFELQTRQSPVQTTFTPPANAYTGLASCVSLNTAVAMRIGKHRVTYQPRPGSAGEASQLELRVDGSLVTATGPITLSGGNTITRASNGILNVRVADGTRVTVTPNFWTTQGYWYLDVDVRSTPAREGTMGPVLTGDWLPRAPDGTSFGAKPVLLPDRHVVLNQKFANAWRVSNTTSLFDYAVGTSTANFTDVNWPPESGQPCRTSLPSRPPLKSMQPELAKTACRDIKNDELRANCLFDVAVMGDAEVARGYLRADRLKLKSVPPASAKK